MQFCSEGLFFPVVKPVSTSRATYVPRINGEKERRAKKEKESSFPCFQRTIKYKVQVCEFTSQLKSGLVKGKVI